MPINPKDFLRLFCLTKQKAHVPKWIVRQHCPQAILVSYIEPNMLTFEIEYDSLEKFFREMKNIHKVYIDEKANTHTGGDMPTVIDYTTCIIKCTLK